MLVLALNCGSSSIKAALIDTQSGVRVLDLREESVEPAAAQPALDRILTEASKGAADRKPIEAVAHRIVHGGSKYVQPTVLDDAIIADIGESSH